jgi:hypothetical protein
MRISFAGQEPLILIGLTSLTTNGRPVRGDYNLIALPQAL